MHHPSQKAYTAVVVVVVFCMILSSNVFALGVKYRSRIYKLSHSSFSSIAIGESHWLQQHQRLSLSKFHTLENEDVSKQTAAPPMYRAEGILAVHKPLTWTSNDVVSYIRGILTRDAQDRIAGDAKDGRNNNEKHKRDKKQLLKVGHGGTLDPLASGVLVLGIGKGTTKLQSYLDGEKHYVAVCELGYETTTLDAEGDIVKQLDWNSVKSVFTVNDDDSVLDGESTNSVEGILCKFRGKIQQVPPLYSAIRVDGKRLYEIAREKSTSDEIRKDLEIPKREVEIFDLQLRTCLDEDLIRSGVVDGRSYRESVRLIKDKNAAESLERLEKNIEQNVAVIDEKNVGKSKRKRKRNHNQVNKNDLNLRLFNEKNIPSINLDNMNLVLPQFIIQIHCGGGTYIRSLVRDIGYELNTAATMTGLVRTKQGPFFLKDALMKEDWTADKIYEAVKKNLEAGKG